VKHSAEYPFRYSLTLVFLWWQQWFDTLGCVLGWNAWIMSGFCPPAHSDFAGTLVTWSLMCKLFSQLWMLAGDVELNHLCCSKLNQRFLIVVWITLTRTRSRDQKMLDVGLLTFLHALETTFPSNNSHLGAFSVPMRWLWCRSPKLQLVWVSSKFPFSKKRELWNRSSYLNIYLRRTHMTSASHAAVYVLQPAINHL